ncbi:MAG: hypothetical protein WD059_01565, partial [Balneolaceae bacterium]
YRKRCNIYLKINGTTSGESLIAHLQSQAIILSGFFLFKEKPRIVDRSTSFTPRVGGSGEAILS